MRYQLRQFVHASGERMAVLVDTDTAHPLAYPTLYSTIHHRNSGDAYNTIKSKLNTIKLLLEVCDYLDIPLEERFARGDWLKRNEVELLTNWLKKKKSILDSAMKVKSCSKGNIAVLKPLKKENNRYGVKIDVKESISTNGYNNITEAAKYIKWLADSLFESDESEQMYKRLIAKRGTKPANSQEIKAGLGEFQSLDKYQEGKVLDIIRPESLNNPWKGDAVRYRNQLIVNLLLDIGCRKGESLNIKTTDVISGVTGVEVNIWRDPDNKSDPRLNQPRVKTLSRTVGLSPQLAEMLEKYVISYRSTVTGANTCPYLFISHQKGTKKAVPMSLSAFNKVFNELSNAVGFKVKPHGLRHTWNDRFSELIEELIKEGLITYEEAEEHRCARQGWRKNSESAQFYTRATKYKKNMEMTLKLQQTRVKLQDNSMEENDENRPC
ncbi:TPA: site-specific integrase [Aeromonas veronii]|uniref:site-specific integrase n=1 Tax=Aeromonas veronii TaxID=654 RepID=UPI00330F0411|nr:site-specific integrase [Aeromonas veronii]HDO1336034.1 site-specific integrase [Aeromonas veronii]HDO1340473.1 site-specific integrase [Aeromonas veronii]HDO1345026.1 site-specific integrase [Aeromonas veronii]HDO1349589.1 site-specific integrase [Aeromonas veronii]